MEEREHVQSLISWLQYWIGVGSLVFRDYNKNLLMFISPQALIPFVMSLFVVFWSSSVAFVPENKKVLMRLAANSPWFPMNIHQHSQPASLCLDLRWGVCGSPHRSQEDPKKGTTESRESAHWAQSGPGLEAEKWFHWCLLVQVHNCFSYRSSSQI